jgi:hypothetical protein
MRPEQDILAHGEDHLLNRRLVVTMSTNSATTVRALDRGSFQSRQPVGTNLYDRITLSADPGHGMLLLSNSRP